MTPLEKINKKFKDNEERIKDIKCTFTAVKDTGNRKLKCDWSGLNDHQWVCYKIKVKRNFWFNIYIKYREYFYECEKCKSLMRIKQFEEN